MANAPGVNTLAAQAVGVRRGKGEFEGTAYDYTKLTVLLPQDVSKGDAAGFGAVEYQVGKSDRYKAFEGWSWPVAVELDMVTVSKGGVARQVISDVRRVKV